MHLHRLLPLLCGLIAIVGCATKPSPIDNSLVARGPSANYSNMSIGKKFPATKPGGFERVKYQLTSGSESDRIQACEQLGRFASENSSDTESINMLAQVMKNDESMKVRIAATDAIGLLKSGDMNHRVASMLPTDKLKAEEASSRFAFVKQLWR